MEWNTETQQRFDMLRQRELATPLSEEEQQELDHLVSILDAEEARYLAPAIERMNQEAQNREAQLAALQERNESLAALVRQHEQLLNEAQAWLASFEQRRGLLHDQYTRLTSARLPTEPIR